ncbi:CRISPR-associated protein Cas5 [Leptospira inadai serovar Lyme str. 10]|uniref:CRISPR-associated protein Cas5 n=2 Tax=Leptospira inadai serovar Lyme TaxID=293084 RepID=V6HAS9_9LEPT|nr:CRISPR-associated protein Cas5 [Leptospira inadai serovar Lyme str. 10]
MEGITSSFRYPHFLIGRQPSFPMPPPATIYGLVASTLGYFPNPDTFSFAYMFRCLGEATDDLEKIWFLTPITSTKGEMKNYNVEATSNVLSREILVQPRLTLYLLSDDIEKFRSAFWEPKYVPVLGRSQDLISIRKVEEVVLERGDKGRIEPGLLPGSLRDRIHFGPTLKMPKFIDPNRRTSVSWETYVALDRPVQISGNLNVSSKTSNTFIDSGGDKKTEQPRLLFFHRFSTISE